MDSSTIVDKNLRKWLFDTAKNENIPVQYKRATTGGNDAGSIHLAGVGVKTASLSVPARYIHSPAGIASLKDVSAVYELARLFLDRIDEVI